MAQRPGPLPFVVLCCSLVAPTARAATGQAAAALAAPALVVPTGTERVEVDLVVRDKHGALLRDLRPDEVELLEDGTRQEIESLELVRPAVAGTALAPSAVALVFDHLSPSARRFARDAALEFIGRAQLAELSVGVFSIDRGLGVVQPFTSDVASLRQAVEAAGGAGTTTLAGKRERELTRNAYHGLGEGMGQAHVAAAEQRGAPECRGTEEVRIRLTELLESRLVEGFESLERDEQGASSLHALLALVGTLGAAPGRKAVILFSEGLVVPGSVLAARQSLTSAANRGRVSFYTVDAGGLRVESPVDELRRTLDTVKTRARDDSSGRLTEDDPLWLRERGEEALRLAPASTLVPLADATGGFALGGTNDLGPGLDRLQEELREHYRLSFAPRNRSYDGRFRSITVRVKRAHGALQARKGYFALKPDLPVPALSYEAPALARLDSGVAASDVPIRVRGLQFPGQPGTLATVPILVEVPSQALRCEVDRKAGTFRQDFTILALVRDAGGTVAAKLSQHYALQRPLAELEPARRGQVLFYREAHLPPGRYAVEAVVVDARSQAAGTARAALDVPQPQPDGIRASSLVLVERAEKAAGEDAVRGPLRYGDVILYPQLAPHVGREASRPLAFFLSAWPAPGRSDLDARVEVLREGRPVATARPFAMHPEADGRVSVVSTVSVERLPPGAYQLRVTLTDGRDAEARTTDVAIGQ